MASDEHTHVFIIRMWRERREIEGAATEWRGVVEHVGSGARRYIRDVDEIAPLIAGHLDP